MATGTPAVIDLTGLTDGAMESVIEEARGALQAVEGVTVRIDADRDAGRAYYRGVCFKGSIDTVDGPIEVADGGLVDWTQGLVASRKERLMISGIGMDRVVMAAGGSAG